MNEFSVLFNLDVEKTESQSPNVEVYNCKYLEISRETGPHIKDALEPYEIKRNIECYEKVEALESGEYECLMSGTWDYEYSYDSEGYKDAELIIDIKFFATQKIVSKGEN